MENIPREVFFDILLRLDLRSLVRLQFVSKYCKNFITSSEFVTLHQQTALKNPDANALLIFSDGYCIYIVTDDPIHNPSPKLTALALPAFGNGPLYHGNLKFIGAANGLVCIWGGKYLLDRYCLLNPTKPRVFRTTIVPFAQTVPRMDYYSAYDDPNEHVVSGFGYDEKSDDYKIVRVWYWNKRVKARLKARVKALIYSFKFGSWRPLKLPMNGHKPWTNCAVLNNSLHFLTKDNRVIIGFDLHEEIWREFELPNIVHHLKVLETSIINGCLSILLDYVYNKEDLWFMKEYGVKESWTNVYTTTLPSRTKAVILYSDTSKKFTMRYSIHGVRRNINVSHLSRLYHWKSFEMKMIIGSLVPVPVENEMITRKSLSINEKGQQDGEHNN